MAALTDRGGGSTPASNSPSSSSSQSSSSAPGRDEFGIGNEFMTPAVADGTVFVGTPNAVAVFGLL